MQKPMLANKYEDKKAEFPCFVQPKFDGVRCMFDGEDAWTRNQKPHKPHIVDMLKALHPILPEGMVLDGELILPKPWTFQKTVSVVKKYYPAKVDLTPLSQEISDKWKREIADRWKDEDDDAFYTHKPEDDLYVSSDLLRYHVYDCYFPDQPELTFAGRMERVRRAVCEDAVETVMIYAPKDLWEWLDTYIDQGYEGLIYRNPKGVYKHGRSGRDLLKLKKFLDDEYQIVGAIEGKGKDKGTPIWVCRVSATDARTFKARPMGTYKWRREAWVDRLSYYGRMLTVKYQELTDDGIPRFPIGVSVRDYE